MTDNSVNIMDCNQCFATRSPWPVLIDVINPKTGRSWVNGHTLTEIQKRYPAAEEMSMDEYTEILANAQNTTISWEPITESEYDEMLGCLPPAYYGSTGFLVGEPTDHDAKTGMPRFTAYRCYPKLNQYWVSNRPMTIKEFKLEVR